MKPSRNRTVFVLISPLVVVIMMLRGLSYSNIFEVEWSPHGQWIVFSCSVLTLDNPKSYLYIMRPDGTQVQKITNDDFVAMTPSWSPNGDWIVFLSSNTLYKIRPDGSEVKEIIRFPSLEVILSVDWASDHNWITFSTLIFDTSRIYRVNENGNNLEILLEDTGIFDRLEWSSSDRMLSYALLPTSDDSGIYSLNPIDNMPSLQFKSRQLLGEIAWSPDDRTLLVILTQAQQTRLYRVSLSDQLAIPIDINFNVESIDWSPDGNWISFSGYRGFDPGGTQVFKARPDGTEIIRLTEMSDCNANHPRWYDFDD